MYDISRLRVKLNGNICLWVILSKIYTKYIQTSLIYGVINYFIELVNTGLTIINRPTHIRN
jgi:hypothetical protein